MCNARPLFFISCPIKHGPRGKVSIPPPRWFHSGAIGPAFLLAVQSEPCIQRSGPPWKKDPEKGTDRLKAGSADWRFKALATVFATTALLHIVLNLTVPSNINLLKTDCRLTAIARLLFSELKPSCCYYCTWLYFKYCIMNKCYLQIITKVPNLLK